MSPLGHLRRFFVRHVLRDHGEICLRCGGRVDRGIGDTWWNAPNELWNLVEGGPGGIRCPSCFVRDCDQRGILIYWRAEVWAPPTAIAEGHPAAVRAVDLGLAAKP